MRTSSRVVALVASLVTFLVPATAAAHLMTVGQGTLTVDGRDAYLVVALPIAAFPGLDADGDGRAEPSELVAAADGVTRAIEGGIRIEGDGVAAERRSLDFTLADHEGEKAVSSSHLVVLEHVAFARTPARITLAVDVLGNAEGAEPVFVRARRGDAQDLVVLRPERTTRTVFARPIDAFREAIELGARHILAGLDHLAFLLALLAAGVTLRRWLVLLSTFTAAHSVSLALAAYGVVHPSPRIVEPLILASIVVVGVSGVLRRGAPESISAEAALVFACGLLHGLGFSSALSDLGLEGARRVWTLLGFNVGLELGQASFVAAAAGLLLLARRSRAGGITWRARLDRVRHMSTADGAP